jgi:hypothetical protein
MSSCHSAVPRTGGRVPAAPFITVDDAHLALTGTTGLEPPSKASNYAPNELDIGSDGMVYFRATDISGKAYWLMVPVGEQAVCLALLWSSIDPNKKRITLRAGPGKGDGPLASYGGDDDTGNTNLTTEQENMLLAYIFASKGHEDDAGPGAGYGALFSCKYDGHSTVYLREMREDMGLRNRALEGFIRNFGKVNSGTIDRLTPRQKTTYNEHFEYLQTGEVPDRFKK